MPITHRPGLWVVGQFVGVLAYQVHDGERMTPGLAAEGSEEAGHPSHGLQGQLWRVGGGAEHHTGAVV